MVRRWISSTGTPAAVARAASSWAIRSVPNRPGRQPVDPDRRDLLDHRLDEPGEPRPDEVGRRQGGDRLARRARQDDEDRRVAALAQVRKGGAEHPDGAPQRAVDRLLPGRLVEVLEPSGRRTARVHDQQVEPAERLDRRRDRSRRTVGRGQVGCDGQRVQLRGHRLEAFATARDEADLGALLPQDRPDRAAEATAAAADERARAVESEVHRPDGSGSGTGGPRRRGQVGCGRGCARWAAGGPSTSISIVRWIWPGTMPTSSR